MRLITQNLLVCNKKTCQAPGVQNFPLRLVVQDWNELGDDSTMPCTKPLMLKLSEKVEWAALRETVNSVSKVTFAGSIKFLILTCFYLSSTGESPYLKPLTKLCSTTNSSSTTSTCFYSKDKLLKARWPAPTLNVRVFTKSKEEFQTCFSTKTRFDL